VITAAQLATLITEPDMTPNLSTIIRRAREGNPMPAPAPSLTEIRTVLRSLRVSIEATDMMLNGTPAVFRPRGYTA